MKKILLAVCSMLILTLVFHSRSYATPIIFEYNSTVSYVDYYKGENLGFSVGDKITGYFIYDPSVNITGSNNNPTYSGAYYNYSITEASFENFTIDNDFSQFAIRIFVNDQGITTFFCYAMKDSVPDDDVYRDRFYFRVESNQDDITLGYDFSYPVNTETIDLTTLDEYPEIFVGSQVVFYRMWHENGKTETSRVVSYLDTINIHYLNPVPEPSTILLFSLGLLGLAGASRRKITV